MQNVTFKSKTFWAGVAMIATGIGLWVNGNPEQGIQTIIGGITAIFIRDGISKVEAR